LLVSILIQSKSYLYLMFMDQELLTFSHSLGKSEWR